MSCGRVLVEPVFIAGGSASVIKTTSVLHQIATSLGFS